MFWIVSLMFACNETTTDEAAQKAEPTTNTEAAKKEAPKKEAPKKEEAQKNACEGRDGSAGAAQVLLHTFRTQ